MRLFTLGRRFRGFRVSSSIGSTCVAVESMVTSSSFLRREQLGADFTRRFTWEFIFSWPSGAARDGKAEMLAASTPMYIGSISRKWQPLVFEDVERGVDRRSQSGRWAQPFQGWLPREANLGRRTKSFRDCRGSSVKAKPSNEGREPSGPRCTAGEPCPPEPAGLVLGAIPINVPSERKWGRGIRLGTLFHFERNVAQA